MRNLKRNKQQLYYALYVGQVTKYKYDPETGERIIVYIDESTTPPTYYYEEDGVREAYSSPVKFEGNIALSGGDVQIAEFGVNVADYEAILVTEKNLLPITETSLIWQNTEPEIDEEGYAKQATADYRVIKLKPSLNEDKYILTKVVK